MRNYSDKETLMINIEIASPAHFIPSLPGWEERSIFIKKINNDKLCVKYGDDSHYQYNALMQRVAKFCNFFGQK